MRLAVEETMAEIKEKGVDQFRLISSSGVAKASELGGMLANYQRTDISELEKSAVEIWAIRAVQEAINSLRTRVELQPVSVSTRNVHVLSGIPKDCLSDQQLPCGDITVGGFSILCHAYGVRQLNMTVFLYNLAHELMHVNTFLAGVAVVAGGSTIIRPERHGFTRILTLTDNTYSGVGLNEGAVELLADIVRKILDSQYPVSEASVRHPGDIVAYPDHVEMVRFLVSHIAKRNGLPHKEVMRLMVRNLLGDDMTFLQLMAKTLGRTMAEEVLAVTEQFKSAQFMLARLRGA